MTLFVKSKSGRFGIGLFVIFLTLSGCIPILVGTAAVTTIDLVLDRRTVGRSIDDNSLEIKLRKTFHVDEKLGRSVNLSVTVVNGIVLLTGEVQKDAQRKRASALAKQYTETRKVVNEVKLSGTTNINSRANDSWITGKVKTKLLAEHGVPASNIKVVTEKGSVYLLGLVTRKEGDKAVEIAQSVRGVTHIFKVFEYIK